MRKILLALLVSLSLPLSAQASFLDVFRYVQPANVSVLGDGTITRLDQWAATSSPSNAITQRVYGSALRFTGLESCSSLQTDSSGIVVCTGGSSFSTSSLNYYQSLFRDWSVQGNGYLAPTTTRGILVSASSTIGDSTRAGGLTISGNSTTTATSTTLGQAGIGTSTPASRLEVGANTTIPEIITLRSATDAIIDLKGDTDNDVAEAGVSGIRFTTDGVLTSGSIGLVQANNVDLFNNAMTGGIANAFVVGPAGNASALQFMTNANVRVTVDTSGRFAVGTTTPLFPFQFSNTAPILDIGDTNAPVDSKHWIISNTDGVLTFGTTTDTVTSSSTFFIIKPSGSTFGNIFGFGTSSPSANYKMSVQGGIYAQTSNGTAFFTGQQGGSSYTNSQAVFTAISDNLTGSANFILKGTPGGPGGTLTTSIRFDGAAGFGTTSPWAYFSINPNNNGTGPEFAIGSSTKTDFVVANTGFVGIGSTTPSTNLSVNGVGYFTSTGNGTKFQVDNTGGNGSQIPYLFEADNNFSTAFCRGLGASSPGCGKLTVTSSGALAVASDNTISLSPNNAQAFIAHTNGNVGVGSMAGNTLVNKFTVAGNAAIGSSYTTTAAPTDGLIIQGNTGIGSTTPGTALGVTGSGGFTGQVYAPNFLATSTTIVSSFQKTTSTSATTTDLAITNLGTAAGAFLAVNAQGSVIATTTPSGGGSSGPPTGAVEAYAGTTAPTGWLLCDGSAVSRSTYATLFALIGTLYGIGDGSTTFNVPNIQNRNIIMASSTPAVGQTGGEQYHTMTIGELVPHSHGISSNAGAGNDSGGTIRSNAQGVNQSGSTNSQGGGAPFNVLDPYIALMYIIKY